MRARFCLVLVLLALASCSSPRVGGGSIVHDADRRSVTLSDAGHDLVLRLDYGGRCMLAEVTLHGRPLVAPETGVCSAVQVGDTWFTTRALATSPTVAIGENTVTVTGIQFGPAENPIAEEWRFEVQKDRILWRITRTYRDAATYDDAYFPGWDFRDAATWTGGLLDTGGVVWTKYLDTPLATYASHSGAVTFWNAGTHDCLRISPTIPAGANIATRFSHHPSGVFSASFSVTNEPLATRHELARFLGDRQDAWAPFTARAGSVSVEYSLQALDYGRVCDRGTFRGLPGDAIRELLDTVGRYGVIDRAIVGSNGWRSGFAVTHEPWIAGIGLAVADPDYTRNCADWLDDLALRAIRPDGRVLSRWHSDAGDAAPGTFDAATGYYEAQWGLLMDSQPSYVINVAEEFDLSADRAWLEKHRGTCRAALEFLLRRDRDGDGLVEMSNASTREGKSSDWIDIVWAAHENALVNAELYEALVLWAPLEELLGDSARAAGYRAAAHKLKAAFNAPVADGGFWDPEQGCYAYWRDEDGSLHGTNLVVPVQFCAIAYGLCDDAARCTAILERIEALMQKEKLFHWPLCFFPFEPDEVHPSQRAFPTYENGDIFLGWGELGVRAYAQRQPAVALAYIRRLLEQYQRDGLSFQRYLRASQKGAGDDILSNNCNTIVGLYRDIYGVQPRPDRLWLEPHLTPELAGTRLYYWLRGQRLEIALDVDHARVACDEWSLAARGPFGVRLAKDAAEFFPAAERGPALRVLRPKAEPVGITIESWPSDPLVARIWTEQGSGQDATLRHRVLDLPRGRRVQVRIDGRNLAELVADDSGEIEFTSPGHGTQRYEVAPE